MFLQAGSIVMKARYPVDATWPWKRRSRAAWEKRSWIVPIGSLTSFHARVGAVLKINAVVGQPGAVSVPSRYSAHSGLSGRLHPCLGRLNNDILPVLASNVLPQSTSVLFPKSSENSWPGIRLTR